MKLSTIVLAAVAGLVSAQDINTIPTCALTCLLDAISKSTKCAATDFKCACANKDVLIAAASPCVIQSCGQDVAINKVLPAASAFCDAANGAPATTGAQTTASPTTSATTAPSTSAGSSASSTAAPTTAASTTMSTARPSNSLSLSGSSSSTARPSGTAVAAGAAVAGSIGTFGMLALGAVAAAL